MDGLNTLIDYRYQQHLKAQRGGNGMGKDRHGASGKDLDAQGSGRHADLSKKMAKRCSPIFAKLGDTIVLADGGNGGFGNAYFKSSTNRAPRHANPGQPGEGR